VVSLLRFISAWLSKVGKIRFTFSPMFSVRTDFASLAMSVFGSSPVLQTSRVSLVKRVGGFCRDGSVRSVSVAMSSDSTAKSFHYQRSGSHAFCQLRKFASCAIIFSRWRAGLAPVCAAGVPQGSPTRRAPDVWEAAHF
jgi:hypothetical protein